MTLKCRRISAEAERALRTAFRAWLRMSPSARAAAVEQHRAVAIMAPEGALFEPVRQQARLTADLLAALNLCATNRKAAR